MPQRSSKEKVRRKRPTDPNKLAKQIVDEAAEEGAEKNAAAVALGRLGGRKGGPARAKKLTKARRSEIARIAAEARWESVRRKKRKKSGSSHVRADRD